MKDLCAYTKISPQIKKIKDIAIFKYNGQIYVINDDITYQEFYYFIDKDGNKYQFFKTYSSPVDMKIPEDIAVYQRTGYIVKKGFQPIEIFEDKESAIDFIHFIYESIEKNENGKDIEDSYIDWLNKRGK
jgi:hypothetical protein